MHNKHILFLLLGIITISFKYPNYTDSENLSVMVIKVKYNSYGMTGFGGNLKVRNTETGEVFTSKSKKGLNPYVIIENLPLGNYTVEELSIISGSNILTLEKKSDFNLIKIDEGKIYYLGNYMTKKVPPLQELNFEITKSENEDEKNIYQQLKKKSENWLKLKIDNRQNLLVRDTTIIQIKKN